MSATKRIYYYDVLNVLSCLSVIALHCNGYVHRFDTDDAWWGMHVFFEVAFYNAVPIFFMLSGATLLGYHRKYDTRTFFRRRFRKAVLPFLAFTVLFYAFYALTASHPDLSLTTIAQNLFSARIPHTNFWFFIPLFLLYAFMPFLSVMAEHLTERQLFALIVLLVFIQGVVEPGIALVDVQWKLPMGGYVAYILLGYYLSRTHWENNTRVLTALCIAALVLMSLRYVGIFLSSARHSALWSYLSLYGYVASAAIFLLVKRVNKCERGGVKSYLSSRVVASAYSSFSVSSLPCSLVS